MSFAFGLGPLFVLGACMQHGVIRNELHVSRLEVHVEIDARRERDLFVNF